MIEQLIAEATECDFKVALETKKPKSWIKSVSAFSNGIGGTLFFGISDDRVEITSPGGMFGGDAILAFCSLPHSKAEIAKHCGYKNTKNFTKKYLRPLLDSGALNMTVPDKPNSRNQKYIAAHTK